MGQGGFFLSSHPSLPLLPTLRSPTGLAHTFQGCISLMGSFLMASIPHIPPWEILLTCPYSFLSCFTKCCFTPQLALGSTAMGHSGLVMDRPEGRCHIGRFLHNTRAPQVPAGHAVRWQLPWGSVKAKTEPECHGHS